jgi:hypothetical protein
MIAKIFLMAKTFRAQSTNYLRRQKSIRYHGDELGRQLFPGGTRARRGGSGIARYPGDRPWG